MTIEKVGKSGWVTVEFLEDAVDGYQAVIDLFSYQLAQWADARGYALLPGTRVQFLPPHPMDDPPLPEMVKVRAVGRAVRVTKLPQVFSQGAINLC